MAVNTETKQMNSLVAEHEIKEIADLDIQKEVSAFGRKNSMPVKNNLMEKFESAAKKRQQFLDLKNGSNNLKRVANKTSRLSEINKNENKHLKDS